MGRTRGSSYMVLQNRIRLLLLRDDLILNRLQGSGCLICIAIHASTPSLAGSSAPWLWQQKGAVRRAGRVEDSTQ